MIINAGLPAAVGGNIPSRIPQEPFAQSVNMGSEYLHTIKKSQSIRPEYMKIMVNYSYHYAKEC